MTAARDVRTGRSQVKLNCKCWVGVSVSAPMSWIRRTVFYNVAKFDTIADFHNYKIIIKNNFFLDKILVLFIEPRCLITY